MIYLGLKLVETDEEKKQHLRDSPLLQIACPIPIRPLLAPKLAKRQLDMVFYFLHCLINYAF